MRYLVVIILLLSPIFFICSCSEYGDFKKADSGLLYRIVESPNTNGLQPKIGDILELKYSYKLENGKEFFNSENGGRRYLKKLEKPSHVGGSFEDGLAMLREGDSAIFKISAENFLLFSEKYGRLPQGVNGTDNFIIKVRFVDIMDEREQEEYVAESYHVSEEQELEILANFLANANIKQEPTKSGMYIIENKEGSGELIKAGNKVTLNYTLTLVDGEMIETTLGNLPMTFVYGRDVMIDGWDEGIAKMKKGSVAKLVIPSKLAYGEEGKGKIMPYSTLIFDIEILDVQ